MKLPIIAGLATVMVSNLCAVDLKTAADASNELAFKILAKTPLKDGAVFSPYSVWSALTLVSAGAKGKTLEEMKEVLNLPKEAGIYDAAGVWSRQLTGGKDVDFSVANRVWLQSGLPLEAEFRGVAQQDFGSGLAEVDFVHAAPKVTGEINGWVGQQTHEHIKELLQAGDLNAAMRLVVTNAVYFKGKWLSPFNHASTAMRPFHPEQGAELKVSTMSAMKKVLYGESAWAQAIRLPYKGNHMSMLVVLPSPGTAPSAILPNLDAGSLKVLLRSMQMEETQIQLPRFRMDQRLGLGATLQALGMKQAFSDAADFSGITKAEPLQIAKVIHQAFVKVEEEGTEAAAATAITMRPAAAPMRPTKAPKAFIADHPFFYFILDDATGGILFAGVVAKPAWQD